MKNNRFFIGTILLSLTISSLVQYGFAQENNQWKHDVGKLKTAASVMFIGVTPEDYNKNIAQYFLENRQYKVGLLSLTRGENSDIDSIAEPLQGVQRGIYHVNKAISKIDKDYSDLYFTRAYDFLSNEREDSSSIFEKLWDRQSIMGDVVWDIRTFQPDVIVFPSYSHLPKQGKRFYSLQMIKDAIRMASDSAFFKEQFDDDRYPWKSTRVLALDSGQGKFDLTIHDSLHCKYDLIAGSQPRNNIMDNIDTSWNRIYRGIDYKHFAKYLDSIQMLDLPKKQRALMLLNLRKNMDSTSYMDARWHAHKDIQLNEMILRYAGVKASINFDQSFLVLGKPYNYTIQYEGDTSIFKLNYVKFGRYDTIFDVFPTKLHIEKQLVFPNNETPYQPYWMSAAMVTPGMYAIGSRNSLDNPTNENPFVGSFIFLAEGCRYKYFIPASFVKPADSVKETPVITLPGFSNIAPGLILTHLTPARKTEKIFVQLQSNFSQKQVPITVNLLQKGLKITSGKNFTSGRNKLILQTKDTVADLTNGKTLEWFFDVPQKVLDSLDGDMGAEVWLGKEPKKLKINSSLAHIPLAGMSDINYHFQPAVTLLSKDTFVLSQNKPVGLLTDSSNIPNLEIAKMILAALHADYKMVNVNRSHLKDSLQQFGQLVLAQSFSNEKDSIISQYTSDGGTTIVLPFGKDSLPSYISDSVNIQTYNLLSPQAGLSVTVNDSSYFFSHPNTIYPAQFPENDIISTVNWIPYPLKQSNTILVQYKTKQSDSIVPLLHYRYGKGQIILNALSMDAASLENPFIYKLWANLLKP